MREFFDPTAPARSLLIIVLPRSPVSGWGHPLGQRSRLVMDHRRFDIRPASASQADRIFGCSGEQGHGIEFSPANVDRDRLWTGGKGRGACSRKDSLSQGDLLIGVCAILPAGQGSHGKNAPNSRRGAARVSSGKDDCEALQRTKFLCFARKHQLAGRCLAQKEAKMVVIFFASKAISRDFRNERNSSATAEWSRCGCGRLARAMAPKPV